MAEILIGDWECTFEELLHVIEKLDYKTAEERVVLADFFETSLDFRNTLDRELGHRKINAPMWIIEVLVDWRSRHPRTATLGALVEKLTSLHDWKQAENLFRELLTQKAKSWNSLDIQSQQRILAHVVIFQGNDFELNKLGLLMSRKFDSFLNTHINQNVIQLVMRGEPLIMEDLGNGFILGHGYDDSSTKHEIKYSADQLLGSGSGNTQVYKGTFGKIPVAVKIILNYNQHKEAENEIKILLQCKGHPNVVIYHASATKSNKYLLALELCFEKTLSDWVKDRTCLPVPIKGLEILRQTTDGVGFLHENQIIHRDLKLSNILFSLLNHHVFVKIADFGISNLLPPGKHSKTVTSYGGSNGSTAPEMLDARELYNTTGKWNSVGAPKITKKVDNFSLGCIFYQVLTNGKHPFGRTGTLLEYNIQQGIIQTEQNMDCLRQCCNLSLINKMIAKNPQELPDIDYIKAHPIFWTYQKMIDFIQELSNFLDKHKDEDISKCVQKFEANYFPKISSVDSPGQGWLINIKDQNFKDHKVFKRRLGYNKDSALKLVRLIRNFNNHFHEEQNKELKNFVGNKPKGFMKYWLKCFPSLLNEMRDAFWDFEYVDCLKQYFTIFYETSTGIQHIGPVASSHQAQTQTSIDQDAIQISSHQAQTQISSHKAAIQMYINQDAIQMSSHKVPTQITSHQAPTQMSSHQATISMVNTQAPSCPAISSLSIPPTIDRRYIKSLATTQTWDFLDISPPETNQTRPYSDFVTPETTPTWINPDNTHTTTSRTRDLMPRVIAQIQDNLEIRSSASYQTTSNMEKMLWETTQTQDNPDIWSSNSMPSASSQTQDYPDMRSPVVYPTIAHLYTRAPETTETLGHQECFTPETTRNRRYSNPDRSRPASSYMLHNQRRP